VPPAFAMPYLRTAKLAALRARTRLDLLTGSPRAPDRPPTFIVGCGRSGTTILGKVFITHPEVTYFREPYHKWRAIDPRTDVTGLHGSIEDTRYFLDREDWSQRAQDRFNALVANAGRPGTRVIEKLPHNVARIGWLESLTDDARYVHIIRNGINVARSIGRIVTHPTYRMAFKHRYAQWWGTDRHRWTALSTEAAARGYLPEEVPLLTEPAQQGAYEWFVSVSEGERWRDALGERLLEITYTELTSDTRDTLGRICAHVGVDASPVWLDRADEMVGEERVNAGDPLRLPPGLASRFNEIQARRDFEGRAEPLETREPVA